MADVRSDLIGCIRFELMSLSELSTDVRASRLLSPDDLLDKIGAKTQPTCAASGSSSGSQQPSSQVQLRGRLRMFVFPLFLLLRLLIADQLDVNLSLSIHEAVWCNCIPTESGWAFAGPLKRQRIAFGSHAGVSGSLPGRHTSPFGGH